MTNEEAIKLIQEIEEDGRNVTSEHIKALARAIQALETGEVYMTGEDYNLYIEGYKAGKNDFEPKLGEWIDVNGDGSLWKCSVCKEQSCCRGAYCPDCGSKMRNAKL